jgi:hypothetical protein
MGGEERCGLRGEVRRVAADERDREEMRIIMEQLAELALPSELDPGRREGRTQASSSP